MYIIRILYSYIGGLSSWSSCSDLEHNRRYGIASLEYRAFVLENPVDIKRNIETDLFRIGTDIIEGQYFKLREAFLFSNEIINVICIQRLDSCCHRSM